MILFAVKRPYKLREMRERLDFKLCSIKLRNGIFIVTFGETQLIWFVNCFKIDRFLLNPQMTVPTRALQTSSHHITRVILLDYFLNQNNHSRHSLIENRAV